MKIVISDELKNKLPSFNPICYTMDVKNTKTDIVSNLLNNLESNISIENVCQDELIKETRDAYKALGKDPSHTRPACEALLRRVIKKQNIYSLGDLIDLGNILSVETKRSVCVVDLDKIAGDVILDVGKKAEVVDAIHRDLINAENLIVYRDSVGIFGSPTSDTLRTSVTNQTTKILVMIICFSLKNIQEDEELLLTLYKKYAEATNIKRILI